MGPWTSDSQYDNVPLVGLLPRWLYSLLASIPTAQFFTAQQPQCRSAVPLLITQLPASSIISMYRLLIQATVANSPLSRSVRAQNGNCLAELHPLLFDYERPSWPSSYFVLAAAGDGLIGDHSDSSSFHPLSLSTPVIPPLTGAVPLLQRRIPQPARYTFRPTVGEHTP